MLNKTVKRTLIILAFSSLGLLNACIIVDDGPYGGYYYYQYYPTLGIYYDTRRHVYFYNHPRHGWTHSRHLPKHYVLKGHSHRRMKTRHAKPWKHHQGRRHNGGSYRGGGHRGGRRGGGGRHRGGGGGGLFK